VGASLQSTRKPMPRSEDARPGEALRLLATGPKGTAEIIGASSGIMAGYTSNLDLVVQARWTSTLSNAKP
jgi:hypothetical protein